MSYSEDRILKEIERQSQTTFLPIIGPAKGEVLVDVIKKAKPKKVLEIGTLVGYSAILMAMHLPKEGKIITIEINPKAANIAQENINEAGFEDKIEIIIGDATKVIKDLKGPFDLLFLDAAKEGYYNYLKAAEPKLRIGSYVIGDNVGIFAEAMADYLKYVRNSDKYTSQTYDFGNDAVEVSIKNEKENR